MAHSDVVTDEEFTAFRINSEILRYLEKTRLKLGLERAEMNVLDWGCGRGISVVHLRDQGYNCFGADVAPDVIARGSSFLTKRGYDLDHCVHLVGTDGKTRFPDGFFHFVFSHYVLEHVQDIQRVVSEIYRLTAPQGSGLHIFPGHRRVVEGHLFMPLIHWLPKNRARKIAINCFVWLGVEPKWKELAGESMKKKTQVYFDYSVRKTFYRNSSSVRDIFEASGFDTSFVSINHPQIQTNKILCRMSKHEPLRKILTWGVLNLRTPELLTIRL